MSAFINGGNDLELSARTTYLDIPRRIARRLGPSSACLNVYTGTKQKWKIGYKLQPSRRLSARMCALWSDLGNAAREALELLVAGVASNPPFDPRTTTRRFTLYANGVGQMVFLPTLVAFLKKEAPNATVRTSPIPLENPGAAIISGDVDVAAGFFDNLTTGFRQSLLFRERYVCAVRANHPKFRSGMSLEAFKTSEHAMADATGMAHAVIDRFLAKQRVQRNVALRVSGFHVLPMIIANSDLLAVIPNRLAQAFVSHVPIKVLPLPISIPPFDIRIYWHERYHHDPALCWFRTAFVKLFRAR